MLTFLSHTPSKVENVSRFLRYVQPEGDEPNLDFLTKSTETRQFLVELKNAGMLPATILNYIKNVIRFLDYLKSRLDLEQQDPNIRQKITSYNELLNTLRKPVAKAHSKQVVKTR